jgi:multimeric flavodoxin WrbA
MGAKKVLVFLGSPRKKGNSAVLAERVMDGARAAGAGSVSADRTVAKNIPDNIYPTQ